MDIEHAHTDPIRASLEGDDALIEELGYQREYRRVFKTVGNMAVVIALTSPMLCILLTGVDEIVNGGHWGLTWGWAVPCVLFFPQAIAIAELCSSMPFNGSSYWWVAALAPPWMARPVSFVSGWIGVVSFCIAVASYGYACAASYAALIPLVHPTWDPSRHQQMAIGMGFIMAWGFLCLSRMERLSVGLITVSASVLLTSALYIIAIPVSHAAQGRPFVTASEAFGLYQNFSEWPRSVAFPMTFFTVAFSVNGWQAPSFVAEETQNARIAAPRAIIGSYGIMAFMGTIVCWVAAFCLNDVESAAADPTGFPLYTMIIDHWGTKLGVAFLLVCVTTSALGGTSLVFSASCQIAAFARDGGMPYSDLLSRVHPRSNMPLGSLAFLITGGFLIILFTLSPEASSIIFSLCVVASYLNLALPVWVRIFAGSRFIPGPFNFGKFSLSVHIWAALSLTYIIILEAFPSAPNPTAATFSWNWVVTLGAILLSIFSYFFIGHRYKGIDVEALQARELGTSNSIDGFECEHKSVGEVQKSEKNVTEA